MSLRPDRIEAWSAHDEIYPEPPALSSAVAIRSDAGWAGPAATHPAT